jgi:DNA-binding SARP family transcriptional activator
MPPVLNVRLLGAFRLLQDREEVRGFDQARLQELLAYLIVRRGTPVPRAQLAFLFWPDSTDEQARTNLRNLLHRLRRRLPGADELLSVTESSVQWRCTQDCRIDVAEFESRLAEAAATSVITARLAALEGAVALYGGDLLPGCYSEWVLAERDRLAGAYREALTQLAGLYEERGDYRCAIAHTNTLLRHDPLHEPAHAQLMRLHALNDDRAGALHAYHTCATVLRRELDVEPGPATRALYERLLGAQPQPARVAPAEAAIPLVGREGEWPQLQQAWRRAAGLPRVVVISGEAGIGKSRLAEALAEWVSRQGIPALTARCYEAGGDLAYAPIVSWLRRGRRPALSDPWMRELSRLLPEIAAERPDLAAPEPLTETWQRLRLFEALTRALVAGQSSLLLVLDDLQWIDKDTLDWLHYLIAGPVAPRGRGQLLVVTTCRCDEQGIAASIATWKADLQRTGQLTEIALGPLARDGALALASRVAGCALDPALADALYRGTEGHPLFIVEMVRSGFERSAGETAAHAAKASHSAAALPEKVRLVLDARLAQLSPAARGVVETAAVVGRAFTFQVVALAADLDEGALVDCLDEAWRKRIIREQGNGAYDFSHDKLREAAYDGLSRTRRRWLHARVAAALQRGHEDDLDRAAAPIAEHLEAAGQTAEAASWHERAAGFSHSIYAHTDALAALDRAIALLGDVAQAGDRQVALARLHETRGDILLHLAHLAEARAAFAAALESTSEREAIARARLRRKTGKVLEEEREPYERVAAEYDAAEELLGRSDLPRDAAWWVEWCQVQLEHLILLYWWNRPDEMSDRIFIARPLIERHGTAYQKATLFSNLAQAEIRRNRLGPTPGAVRHARAALAVLPPSASDMALATHRFNLGFYLLWNGEYSEAEQTLVAALRLAEQVGDVTVQARCLAYLTIAHRRQGAEEQAAGYARRTLGVAQTAGNQAHVYTGTAYGAQAWLAERQGALADAERLGQLALQAFEAYGAPYPLYWQALWPLLAVALAQERVEDAILRARRLVDPEQQPLEREIAAQLAAALAAWDAGRADVAQQALTAALRAARERNLT